MTLILHKPYFTHRYTIPIVLRRLKTISMCQDILRALTPSQSQTHDIYLV